MAHRCRSGRARQRYELLDSRGRYPAPNQISPGSTTRRQSGYFAALRRSPLAREPGSLRILSGIGRPVIAQLPAAATLAVTGKTLLRTRLIFCAADADGCEASSYGPRNTSKVAPVPPGNAVAVPTKEDIRARIHTVDPGTPVSSLV